MFRFRLLLCVGLAAASGTSESNSSQFNACSYAAEDVLLRDVVIIGGGASGTYGAIALKDMGRSVVVVEKEPHFGGHVNTVSRPGCHLICYNIH
jgi:heterodisulfide reductase subunit A-like polyferredoxin